MTARCLTEDEVVAIQRLVRRHRVVLTLLSPFALLAVGGALVMGATEVRGGAWLFGIVAIVSAVGMAWLFAAFWRSSGLHARVTVDTPVERHAGVFDQIGGRVVHFRIGNRPVVFLDRSLRAALRVGERCEVELVIVSGPALVIAVR